jgi:hypothetical protein
MGDSTNLPERPAVEAEYIDVLVVGGGPVGQYSLSVKYAQH